MSMEKLKEKKAAWEEAENIRKKTNVAYHEAVINFIEADITYTKTFVALEKATKAYKKAGHIHKIACDAADKAKKVYHKEEKITPIDEEK